MSKSIHPRTNLDRAKEAEKALARYLETDPNDSKCSIIDLLGDLQHYCDWKGIEFRYVIGMATNHYQCEVEDSRPCNPND